MAELRLVVATPVPEELCSWLQESEPRLELVHDSGLLPPRRYAGDHHGDPGWRRSAPEQERFEKMLMDADALYGIPDQSPELLARIVRANPRLRWVQTMAAGGAAQVTAARLDDDTLGRVSFTTSAGVHAPTLSEFALFGLLAGAKNLPRLLADQRDHRWPGRWPMGQLHEQTVVVVGLGHLGRGVAHWISTLGGRVLGVNRTVREVPGVQYVAQLEQLPQVAQGADAMVVILPDTRSTTGLVDATAIAAMRSGATVVNIGRGRVIEEDALVSALRSGHVGFAALDVTAAEPLSHDSPLWDLPNVLISPHTAALSPQEDRRIAELVLDNARRLLDGRPLLNQIHHAELVQREE